MSPVSFNSGAAGVGLIFGFLRDFENDIDSVEIKLENSPWVTFSVWVFGRGEFRFALWRSSGTVYRVGLDGVVDDDPIERFEDAVQKAGH